MKDAVTIDSDIVINVNSGIYPGFKIPRSSLLPLLGTGRQLIIRSNGNFFPVVDGGFSPTGVHVGADVESANPNVVLQGLRMQNFSVGIRATNNSHNITVKRCIVSNNTNAGILVEQCTNTQLINNVVTNGDYGIVTRLCKNIALIHNTVLLNGTVGSSEAAIWAQLANNYGGGTTDTGKLYMLGNVAWNMAGNTLILFQEDLEEQAVVSNFNDWVRSGDNLIGIEKKGYVPTTPRKRRPVVTLKEWKSQGITSNPDSSPLDSKSISQDPKFLQPIRGRNKKNGVYVDLSLMPVSPVLGIVPSFYFNTTAANTWLPSYVDPSDLSTDILNNARLTAGTAAGANEKRSNSGYFGQDIFINPRDLNPRKDCDVDPLRDLIFKSLDLWFPKLTPGFFSSHEREYYLYARKNCRRLGECAVTSFRLPARVVPDRPVKVSVAGENIEDPRYIDIRGDVVLLYHFDLDIQDRTEEFELQCWIRKWDNTTDGFTYFPTHYRFKIYEGTTRYLIPPDYVSKGPVVITDDTSAPTDAEELSNREFRVQWDKEEQRAEVLFANHTNGLLNPQFGQVYGAGEATPYGWAATNSTVFTGAFFGTHRPVMGDNMCKVSASGSISQIVPITSGNYAFSWHAMATSGNSSVNLPNGTGDFLYEVRFYDADYDDTAYYVSGSYRTQEEWIRPYITFGGPDPNENKTVVINHPLSGVANHSFVPEIAAFADLRLINPGNDTLWVDATQFEQETKPTPYHQLPSLVDSTIEYETSDSEEFTDYRQSLSPIRNIFSQGFLYIPEIPAAMYGGPRIDLITTLYDYKWQDGRTRILPWARLTGKDKLRHKSVFNTVPEPPKPRIEVSHPTYVPFDIRVIPDEIVARQGNKNGVGLQAHCVNEEGNPFSLGNFFARLTEPQGRFPGWLHKKFFGAKEQLGFEVITQLDSAGAAQMLWVPPDEKTVMFVGDAPKRPRGGIEEDAISSVEVNYRAHIDFHGNVIVLDGNYNPLPTTDTSTNTNVYKPSYSQNRSIVRLKYPPTPGTVRVILGGKFLTETFVDTPDSDQFFVDHGGSQIILRGRVDAVTVEYRPSYVFINTSNPYRIQFYHDQVFGTYTGPVVIGYDAVLTLTMYVGFPTTSEFTTTSVPLIAQNYLTSQERHINSLSAEY
ncbi:MAG: NosD domain-containing protein [Candidatus Thorarchaeota archaeon]